MLGCWPALSWCPPAWRDTGAVPAACGPARRHRALRWRGVGLDLSSQLGLLPFSSASLLSCRGSPLMAGRPHFPLTLRPGQKIRSGATRLALIGPRLPCSCGTHKVMDREPILALPWTMIRRHWAGCYSFSSFGTMGLTPPS